MKKYLILFNACSNVKRKPVYETIVGYLKNQWTKHRFASIYSLYTQLKYRYSIITLLN